MIAQQAAEAMARRKAVEEGRLRTAKEVSIIIADSLVNFLKEVSAVFCLTKDVMDVSCPRQPR